MQTGYVTNHPSVINPDTRIPTYSTLSVNKRAPDDRIIVNTVDCPYTQLVTETDTYSAFIWYNFTFFDMKKA